MEPKSSSHRLFCRVIAVALFSLPCFVAAQTSAARPSATQPVGPGNVVVSTKFGGQIFGFDVDQNGTEGILADVRLFNNGDVLRPSTSRPAKSSMCFPRKQTETTTL
jgi:hypothetical protein